MAKDNRPKGVGIIGCGNISGIYFQAGHTFRAIQVVACADLDREKAEAKAREFGVQAASSTEELLNDARVEIVLNLTVPGAHFSVSRAALEARKHVYVEKPLSLTLAEGRELVELAAERGLRLGGAPDTFLGGGHQTCRKLIDDGAIGEPIGAAAFMLCHGHESWHPDPEFYYKLGGGPMFDMGPYYLTALVNLMGPVRRITGATRVTFQQRTVTSAPKRGTVIDVEVPTHVAGVLEFASGAIGTITTSFDVWASRLPCLEVYGSEGSLSVPDPNGFGGPVQSRAKTDQEWNEARLPYGYLENSRGLGVADMAQAIQAGRQHRANGELMLHVLEIMHGIHAAADTGTRYMMTTSVDRPALLPLGLAHGIVE